MGTRVAVLPVIHGSGDYALAVRRWMLEHDFDCIAVPLPESFRRPVEHAVRHLPVPSIVLQPPGPGFDVGADAGDRSWQPDQWSSETPWSEAGEEADDEDDLDQEPYSFVPVDPCQPVITAIRAALGEHIPRAYIDMETASFQPQSAILPDPYALKHVSPERFAAAVLPSIPRPPDRQTLQRLAHMAWQLQELEQRYQRILFVCNLLHWPWVRQAFTDTYQRPVEGDAVQTPETYDVDPRTLNFLFGELPFITGLYERARAELGDDENLSIDGLKELFLASRDSYRADFGRRARPVTPLLLSQCIKYIRNLSLMERRMTPDLYTIITAAKQILGDQFALHVVERACEYPYEGPVSDQTVALGVEQCRFPDGQVRDLVSRLPGPSTMWKTVELKRRPTGKEKQRWQYSWNPFRQCSYPPEDVQIENFRTRVFDRAQAIIGSDLARTEKFTTSVKDGIDIRDTLRHWYDQQIYVRVVPPSGGKLDACVMLFDSPADPRDYPWRTTWFAEHDDESTMAFYATDFREEMVGPGIGMSVYGGAMFLYPPIVIPEIWTDRRLDFVDSLEERLLAAACLHARGRQIALVSSLPPGAGWRRLAKRFKKQLVHVPLGSFSSAEVQQLRMAHVLNGTEIRSFAAHFIRKA
ncbi:hypothetical protein [Roseimaritima sediminicola]|uniref:hypothetical protein n=1 Tax=Roseimaritima sediminicola TaxID=2662066 RepID=UPI0012983DDE|nr:hypothetical protein [Roseimaritima sediminicola]